MPLAAAVAVGMLWPAAATTLSDGDSANSWRVVFAGYGSVRATASALNLRPAQADQSSRTHAALVVDDDIATDSRVRARVTLNEQLRIGSPANAWEAGWVIVRYTDPEHFYYAACKTNGWELGKRDPAYPGGQRFLATGDDVCAREGSPSTIVLTANGKRLRLKVAGVTVTTFTDRQSPYRSGFAGMYSEDADVTFDRISVSAA